MPSPTPRRCWPRSTAGTRDGAPLSGYTGLAARRVHRVRLLDLLPVFTPTGSTRPRDASPASEQSWVAPEWGWAWPANRRILYNRASADPDGQTVERAQGLRVVGRGRRATGPGTTSRTSSPDKRPDYRPPEDATGAGRDRGHRPVHHAGRREGLAVRAGRAGRRPAAGALRAGGVARSTTRSTRQQSNPARETSRTPGQPATRPSGSRPGSDVFPYVFTTYRLTEHHTAGGMSRFAALPVRAAAGVLLRGLPGAGRRARAWSTWAGPRSSRPARRSRHGCW